MAVLREDGHIDEYVQVQPFHEDPGIVGHNRVVEQREKQLTLPMLKHRAKQFNIGCSINLYVTSNSLLVHYMNMKKQES